MEEEEERGGGRGEGGGGGGGGEEKVGVVIEAHIQYVCVGLALVRVFELGVANEDGVHVGAGVLVQLAVVGDHDNGNLTVTQDGELIGFLQQASLTLTEGDLRGGGEKGRGGRGGGGGGKQR